MKISNGLVARRSHSIFTSRNGKQDCHVFKFTPAGTPGVWGSRVEGGYERMVMVIACESGEILRNYEATDVDLEELKRLGLID